MKTIEINGLDIALASANRRRLCVLLSPFAGLEDWAERTAVAHRVSIALVTGMDWDNDLTPWPAKGVPDGSPDFEGRAPQFLATLAADVLPRVEQEMAIAADAERTLAGVSLSGLFALWQWMVSDRFDNIISLSGSFWYQGFAQWVTSRPAPRKTGRAYFLLGDQEARSPVPAFRTVQTATQSIVNYLQTNGIPTQFDLVPGNHYEHSLQRLNRAFAAMFGKDKRK